MAGLDNSTGILSSYYLKDANDPQWKDDAGYKDWLAFTPMAPDAHVIEYRHGAKCAGLGFRYTQRTADITAG
jgi:hypothetical protein